MIHRPYEIWPILAAFRIERVYVIFMIVVWLGSGPSLSRGNRLHWAFAAFILVMLASWMASPCGSTGDAAVENYLKYAVFYTVLVTSVRSEKDLRQLLTGYLASMALWVAHCLREFYNGSATWTQGILRLVPVGHSYDFNDCAGMIVCSLPFAWIMWRQRRIWWQRLLVLGYCGMAGHCIMLTGSRMGFIGAIVAGFMACLASTKRWLFLVVFPVLLVVVWAVLPADRKARYFTLYDADSGVKTGATASAGNLRLNGFVASLPLFADRPLLGYGPMGFAALNRWMPHNLYGQLLAELGLAGAIAFASILWGVGRNVFESRRIARCFSDPGEARLALDTVAAAGGAYIVLAFMSWGFNFLFWPLWLLFGGFQVVALQVLNRQLEEAQEYESRQAEIEDAWQEAAVES